jgi:hypothetical protein
MIIYQTIANFMLSQRLMVFENFAGEYQTNFFSRLVDFLGELCLDL